jgi:cell division protein FtsX
MSLPRHLFTPAFRHQHLGRSFAIIVGIMVFIATFATAAEAVLLTVSVVWGQTADSRITVEIPAVGDETSVPQSERVKEASAILRALPGVGMVMPLSDEEVGRLLNPWFSQPELLKVLPLPTLIDVERTPGSLVTAEQIQDSLKNTISDARVDDHGAWILDIWRIIRGLTIIGLTTIILTGITLIISVNLLCRTVMATEHETISLLHTLGANDFDIARHFQAQTQRISFRAAFIGFTIAVLLTAGLLFLVRSVIDISTLQIWHWTALGLAAFLIPVCATILAGTATRFSVLRLIKSFP